MINAIIIDDEQKSISTLNMFLHTYCPQVVVAGSAENIKNGKELILSTHPELIFLDIEMPYGDGFSLLQSLPFIDFEIIFITAFDQYSLNAFRYSALDYLLKPINIQQLQAAVKRAEQRISDKTSARNYELLLHNLAEQDAGKQKISINNKTEQHFVQLDDIMYCIAEGAYTYVHATGRKKFVCSRNLKEFENMLPPDFFCRIHHGHIINIMHVDKIQKGRGGAVLMHDGKELEIAIRRKEDFLDLLLRKGIKIQM